MNGAMAQTAVGENDLANAYATQTITGRIAVHDPSIVMDVTGSTTNPKYYIYGSHLGRAKTYASGNYQIWNTFKTGEENAGTSNSLFADVNGKLVNFKDAYSTQMVKKVKNYKGEEVDFPNFDAHAWQAKGNNVKGMQWAPDVIYNKTMKKWCMYMSLNGDNWCSTIVCFISDDLEDLGFIRDQWYAQAFREDMPTMVSQPQVTGRIPTWRLLQVAHPCLSDTTRTNGVLMVPTVSTHACSMMTMAISG